MTTSLRSSGIPAVGQVPWGTHFCQFYRTQADLQETLVPSFEAGLRDNESCLWVTSEKLEADKAESLMVDAMPGFKRYLTSGQMQIVSIDDWYTPGTAFDADAVLAGWIRKEAESKARGFSGLRLTGDTFWVQRSGWNDFMDYENRVNGAFKRYHLVALCTYCMDKCSAEDVIDVCCQHQFALARRAGQWELLESSSLKIAKEHLNQLNAALERRVEERTAELNASLRARDEFLAMLGHELRNPLAPIRNATEVIRALTPPESPILESTAILDRQVRHLTRLVSDLLDVARITQRRIKLDVQPLALADVIDQALETTRSMLAERGHSLAVSLPARQVRVSGDRTRLAQVFSNLLHNAVKYTPDGGTVGIRAEPDGEHVRVIVSDDGPGIPEEMLGSVFDLFTQLPRSLARSDGGLGIGLTLVHRLTAMHGGTVEARRRDGGRGAEFVVRLPLLAAPAAPAAPILAEGASAPDAPAPCRILVIDDHEDGNASMRDLLQISGHEVASAHDGASGLAAAARFRPDLILLDIGLPDMDGYEVARRLRADAATRGARLVALTGYGQPSDRARSRSAGFDEHLLKPAEIEELLDLIARLHRPLH